MGSRTRAAEQRVEEQRRRIGVMIEELESRLREDVDSVRSGISERVEAIGDRLAHTGDSVPGADTVRAQVDEHPLTSMLGGFGAGVALGSPVQDEVRALMKELVGGFLGNQEEGRASSSRSSESRDGAGPERASEPTGTQR
ncbi:MAG: hypothetical protein O2822_07320 [Chloroflexi bacterium]|nr:hypothetical protein [Chloroflexota bacterium]